MSKFIYVDELLQIFGISSVDGKCKGCNHQGEYKGCDFVYYKLSEICDIINEANQLVHMKVQMLIANAPAADVVSREQYNLLYEECLTLRTQNKHIMDSLRAMEDERK